MEFIEKYARVDGSDNDGADDAMSGAGGDQVTCSDEEFIDDETNVRDQAPSDYRVMNMKRDLQEAMQDRSMAPELNLVSSDLEKFVSDYIDEIE